MLVADDDTATVLIISNALKEQFEIVRAATGAEVLERVVAGDIDLVLLDVLMPGMDGFDICRSLKANPATANVPVVFVTILEESDEEARGFEAGGVDYITKPIRPAIVRARVRTHVELKRTRDKLEMLATHDPLTGVANRRRFDVALDEEWRRALRAKSWLSIGIVDVDHFKRFNDRYGHLAGDERLRRIAGSLTRYARRVGDLVARFGGEEFALILPLVDSATMPALARNLLCGVAALESAEGEAGAVTVSIGAISMVPSSDIAPNDVVGLADQLLYEAKHEGRDRAIHMDLATRLQTVVRRS